MKSYDPTFFDEISAIEERHFWHVSRTRVIVSLFRQIVEGTGPACRVLEVGCGTGNVLRALRDACPSGMVVGLDAFPEGLRHARARGARALVQADVLAAPFRRGFHVVGVFDVLEHLVDDFAVLSAMRELLLKNGALLVTVPADPALWSYFDEASCHQRRYTSAELRGKLERAGFRVEYLTPYMSPLYAPMWLSRRIGDWRRRFGGERAQSSRELSSADLKVIPVVNEVARLALAPELELINRRVTLPVGTSLIGIARKV